ncbi:enoyl-CoA delta isomerase 2, peroxisomal-like [Dioscorea cayenensis subsp. rotundata]|uniref:Delta(3)-Delta(2)-enoyl-CoA isomerase n=1 Tax=Dioscorea cayennensis subsp. rotundata TaxID=55577 RepID=A0AB40CX91_DIOCR|nr:enoyl-CoA delta isomerase 2, peroxisomal-like [Dioscorea cayenensis subsp. rotundata]
MCTLEKRGRVYILTLTGSNEHRFNLTTVLSIRSALAQVRSDSGAGASLVTAAEGKFFSNGLDVAWISASTPDLIHQYESALRAMIADLVSLPMPTIASITGHAAGGGFIFARAHDYVVMRGDRGFIYMNELDIGERFRKYGMSVLRSRISDARVLRDLVLRPEKMKAGEAERKGVIDRAVEGAAEETVAVAVRMADEMAAKGWDGGVYASIRKRAFPKIFRDLGLGEDIDEDISRVFTSKL